MYRIFNEPSDNQNLERDANGHRTGFKCMIKVRRPMQPQSWERWGHKQRVYIAKSKKVWVYYNSTKAIKLDNGIPIDIMRNNKTMAEWMILNFTLASGDTYAVHGYCKGFTKTKVKLTKALAIIDVHDVEKMTYTLTKFGRLSRYEFRKKKSENEEL